MSKSAGGSNRFKLSPREWKLLAGFSLVIITVYVTSITVGWIRNGMPSVANAVLEPLLYPMLFFYAPPMLGFYNDFRGGSLLGSLLLGAIPGVTFPILAGLAMIVRTGPADSPAWAMSLAFLVIGVVSASVGVIVSRLSQWILRNWE